MVKFTVPKTQISSLQFLILSGKQPVLDTSSYMNTNTFPTAVPAFTAVYTQRNHQSQYNSRVRFHSAALIPPSINTASKAGQEQQLHRKATQYRPVLHLRYSKSLENTMRKTRRWEGTHKKTPIQPTLTCCNEKSSKKQLAKGNQNPDKAGDCPCLVWLFSGYCMKHKGTLTISRTPQCLQKNRSPERTQPK